MVQVPLHLIDELRRRAGRPARWVEDAHPKQRGFILDKCRQKAAVCSRRSGKSYGVAGWLLEGGMRAPELRSVYITLSRGKAFDILWPALRYYSREYGLGLTLKTIEGSLNVLLPNGHRIWLAGCDDKSEVEKFRGEPLTRAVVDEAQSFGDYLESLVNDALRPALMDHQGDLALIGTPGLVCAGFFYDITEGKNPDVAPWSTHRWTALDNTFLPHAAQELEAVRAANNWKPDHPTYRREWLGEWVNDAGSIIYPIDPVANAFQELPEGRYSYYLGVDIGFTRSTALTLMALRRPQNDLWCLGAWKRENLLPTQVAEWCRSVYDEWRTKGISLPIVVDEGGLGVGYAEQLRSFGVGCEPASKTGKRAAQEWLRGLVISGQVRFLWTETQPLIRECATLAFGSDQLEDPRFTKDAADAFLYASRALVPALGREPEPPPPAIGSPEWFRQEQAKEKQKAVAQTIAMQRPSRRTRG